MANGELNSQSESGEIDRRQPLGAMPCTEQRSDRRIKEKIFGAYGCNERLGRRRLFRGLQHGDADIVFYLLTMDVLRDWIPMMSRVIVMMPGIMQCGMIARDGFIDYVATRPRRLEQKERRPQY